MQKKFIRKPKQSWPLEKSLALEPILYIIKNCRSFEMPQNLLFIKKANKLR